MALRYLLNIVHCHLYKARNSRHLLTEILCHGQLTLVTAFSRQGAQLFLLWSSEPYMNHLKGSRFPLNHCRLQDQQDNTELQATADPPKVAAE